MALCEVFRDCLFLSIFPGRIGNPTPKGSMSVYLLGARACVCACARTFYYS